MSLRSNYAELAALVLAKSDLQSIFAVLVFVIVTLVLAYLTNPTENSFRTYLTEQSFRHHLKHLDDNLDSETGIHEARSIKADRSGSFHFANRAAISLRTPKHVFHSFAIFTIAAMIPVKRSSLPSDESDGWSISDSWYIGAFGRWWRGGVWETWYQDVIARSKDEESWSSGILSMKNLDMLPDFHGAGSYMSKSLPYHLLKQSPPRLRNRESPVRKSPRPRSTSPPPLSKSASLPLHAKRIPPAATTAPPERCEYLTATSACKPLSPAAPAAPSTRSTLFEQSPLIAEVLRQISVSSAAVQELRAQRAEAQASAAQSHGALNAELESCRERKRQDDAARSEIKSKTKCLDDQKRTAEGLKREAERKLKAARTTRDSAIQRIAFLEKEVLTLHQESEDDRTFLEQKSSDLPESEVELIQALENRKSEIKLAEEALLALNRRSRELEEKLVLERERLDALKQKTELRMRESAPSAAFFATSDVQGDLSLYSSDANHPHVYDQLQISRLESSPPSPVHPIDALHSSTHPPYAVSSGDPLYSDSPIEVKGYPSNDLLLESRRSSYPQLGHSPTADRVDLTKTLQFDNDPALNQAWNNHSLYSLSSTDNLSTPATSLFNGAAPDGTSGADLLPPPLYDPAFEFSPVDQTPGVHPWSSRPDELGFIRNGAGEDSFNNPAKSSFSTNGRLKKGLNPGAKEFSLPSRRLSPPGPALPLASANSTSTYDALNPTGLGNSLLPSASSSSSSFLRAFAPSRAEREALQRALGGSTNSSLERLPSLSEVGSLPTSPSHAHAAALNLALSPLVPSTAKDPVVNHKTFNLPSWLTVLPNIRKTRFKPWDDEEPASSAASTSVSDGMGDGQVVKP